MSKNEVIKAQFDMMITRGWHAAEIIIILESAGGEELLFEDLVQVTLHCSG